MSRDRKRHPGIPLIVGAAVLTTVLPACGPSAAGEGPQGAAPAPPAVEEPMAEPSPIQPGQAPDEGPYAPGIDVLDYQVELDLREGSREIRGRTRIRFLRILVVFDRRRARDGRQQQNADERKRPPK